MVTDFLNGLEFGSGEWVQITSGTGHTMEGLAMVDTVTGMQHTSNRTSACLLLLLQSMGFLDMVCYYQHLVTELKELAF